MTRDSLFDRPDPWLSEEYPTIWALAVAQDTNERMGHKSSQIENEAAAVMYEIWQARQNARGE